MKIEVTKDDIISGEIRNAADCMVAKALKRQLGLRGVSVAYETAVFSSKVYRLPKDVSNKIRAFDNMEEIKPFSFELELEKAEAYV